jgi:hypothetical protein
MPKILRDLVLKADERPQITGAICFVTRREANSVPLTNRSIGPKLLAAEVPTK